MKVIIACGGTGGHLFPGLAVAESLLARRHEVQLLVSEKSIDQQALTSWRRADGSALAVHSLSAVGFDGSHRWTDSCFRLGRATRDCLDLCREYRPHAVLGMGGFTSAPAVLAARWGNGHRIPAVIHESNAIPGRANRWVGKLVNDVALGLADCARFFGRRHVTVTGTPIRSALRRGRVANAQQRLGLEFGRHTVLVMGGSQGAHAINETVVCALPWLADRAETIQFVHLSGDGDEEFVRESYEKNGMVAKVMGFSDQMELAYSAADLVIARAGAATLTEIAAFGLPSILIPYPLAAGNHQLCNARVLERAGAARVIEEARLSGLHAERGELLADSVMRLLDDEPVRQRMAAAVSQLDSPNAAERIADLLEQYAE